MYWMREHEGTVQRNGAGGPTLLVRRNPVSSKTQRLINNTSCLSAPVFKAHFPGLSDSKMCHFEQSSGTFIINVHPLIEIPLACNKEQDLGLAR